MDKKTKIISIVTDSVLEEVQENSITKALLNTLSDLDQELEQHLNSDDKD